MATLKQSIDHTSTTRVYFTAGEVRQILTEAACKVAKINAAGCITEVDVTQEKEGSPSYSVSRWTAMVKLVEGQPGNSGDLPTRQVSL